MAFIIYIKIQIETIKQLIMFSHKLKIHTIIFSLLFIIIGATGYSQKNIKIDKKKVIVDTVKTKIVIADTIKPKPQLKLKIFKGIKKRTFTVIFS